MTLEIKFMLYCLIANAHTKVPNKFSIMTCDHGMNTVLRFIQSGSL